MENKRINNLEFGPASYLLPKEEWPEHPSYNIDLFYPNPYYGRDEEFPESPLDPNFRTDPKYFNFKIHKSSFKHKECCFAIASFDWDKEGYYELHFICDRPIEYLLTPEDREIFWELIKYGNEQLNKEKEE